MRSSSALATQEMAGALAAVAEPGDVIVLTGDLGAGKTAFVQGFGRALGVSERITSPTFTLVHTYEGRLRVHHIDVYRLDAAAEVRDLALPELLDEGAVALIEWGEMVLPELPRDRLQIEFRFGPDVDRPDERVIDVILVGRSWVARNPAIRDALIPWTGNHR